MMVAGVAVDDAEAELIARDLRTQTNIQPTVRELKFRHFQRGDRLQKLSLSYLPSVGLSWSSVRSADPGVLGMAVSLSPLDGSKNLAARSPATTRPLIGIRDSIAV
ncbi:hypothetical protein QFZ24_000147 [Streptomyces phaeochromogenes]|nr:hypothetical protein [Streptomyces phaeochromogenes]